MRLIDADALLEDLTKAKREVNCHLPEIKKLFKALRDWIKDAPTVDAVPVKHGRWIGIETENAYDIVGIKTWALRARCSECGFVIKFIEAHTGQYIYCPRCGAKMDGEKVSV